MVLPLPLMEEYERKHDFVHSTVSKVDQLIMQRFLEEGYYERHLNKTRAMYKSRHDVLLDGLRPMADILSVSGEHAGVHLLLNFHNGMTEEELIQRAAAEDVRVYGLSDYRIRKTGDGRPTILLGYANMTERQIQEAVKILESCFCRSDN